MKKFISIVLLLSLVSCAGPSIIIKGNGDMEIIGYQAVNLQDGKKTFVYKPWYQVGFIDSIIKAFSALIPGPTSQVDSDKSGNVAKNQKLGFPYDLGRNW